ncbi:Oxysterol-binding protein-related protein 1D [Rhynchospora pubera]|uniref:Oxysterol-binding protein-related protein 1D n=1 Tax=Rhynchospora pubera TaxID=906938 RepID=A0AAV8DEB8_9POAL|nr:Oxysterol-binding protein-related protein 1D [Rhynchospora pubera]
MNPLCCIAPVSLDAIDSTTSSAPPLISPKPRALPLPSAAKPLALTQSPTNPGEPVTSLVVEENRSNEACNGAIVVAGLLYKWVNYGKGWRSRWFVLEDGVLSYYKVHGPDRISVGPVCGANGGVRVIGEDSLRRVRRDQACAYGSASGRRWKPFGEIHLKVSSIRPSKSDDKRLYIFSGTKTLHLRCESREDRNLWVEALVSAKDQFPRVLTNTDLGPTMEIVVSTDKLRARLLQEGLSEVVVKECESIMSSEVSDLQNQLQSLHQKHVILLDKLRQLETEKFELETTVIDATKEREAHGGVCNGRYSDFYSVMSEGSATESDPDNESQGANAESDEEEVLYFDTKDFLSAESLRSASYRSRDSLTSRLSGGLHDLPFGIKISEYPYVKRRDRLPEPKEKEKPVGLWSIIKENIGKDLSGVCLPVYFNEPLSSLQKCFEDLEYSYLVDRALEWGKQGNSLMRILHIAAFAVSGYASTEGRQCKPFNPLLGETYEANYPDKGLRFFSEKVSHHPMIVACHCEGQGWNFWGDSNLKGKFWGRSIQLDPIGILTLQFDDGETFQWSKVTTSIYNIIIGKIYCDHYGTMRIKGSGQYSCKLKFKEQSIIDRNPHQVHGFVQDNRTGEKVAMLIGKWDEAMYYVLGDPSTKPKGYDPMSEAVLLWERDKAVSQTRYNLTPFAISLNELTPSLLEKLPPTDSRLRPDQRFLENGEYEMANAEKLRLEHLQRQARKLQEKGWQPRWFRKDREDDCYRYVGGYWEAREKGNWDGIPNIFGQTDASQIVE